MKKIFKRHIFDRAFAAFGLLALLVAGVYFLYIAPGNGSVAYIRSRIIFTLGSIVLVPVCLFKIKQFILLLLDMLTGMQTKRMVVVVKVAHSERYSYNYKKLYQTVYAINIHNNKKVRFICDAAVAPDNKINKRTHYSLVVLKYSNFVVECKVGKPK